MSFRTTPAWVKAAEAKLESMERGTSLHYALTQALSELYGEIYFEDCCYLLPRMDQDQLVVASSIVRGLRRYGGKRLRDMNDEQREKLVAQALVTEAVFDAFSDDDCDPGQLPARIDLERSRFLKDGEFRYFVISRVKDTDRICSIIRERKEVRVPVIEALLDGTTPTAIIEGVL